MQLFKKKETVSSVKEGLKEPLTRLNQKLSQGVSNLEDASISVTVRLENGLTEDGHNLNDKTAILTQTLCFEMPGLDDRQKASLQQKLTTLTGLKGKIGEMGRIILEKRITDTKKVEKIREVGGKLDTAGNPQKKGKPTKDSKNFDIGKPLADQKQVALAFIAELDKNAEAICKTIHEATPKSTTRTVKKPHSRVNPTGTDTAPGQSK